MIKTFISGVAIGAVGIIGALHFLPAVNISREISLISVSPNGGNSETFHVNIPADRIMLGAQGKNGTDPAELSWPSGELFRGMRGEIFKVRNSKDAVIGVASRVAVQNAALGDVIEWVVHLPARGSMYVTLAANLVGDRRVGDLRAGTREFNGLHGALSESWVAAGAQADEMYNGRIELVASYKSLGQPGAASGASAGGEK